MPSNTPPDLSPADWDAIARDYAAGILSVSAICALHAVSTGALYLRAHSEGWPLRRNCRRRSPSDLTQRLLVALDLKMTQFENRMNDAAGPITAADSERDARTLNTLVRLFETLKGFGETASARRRGAAPRTAPEAAGKDAHEADRLRQELAQRLEKLRAGLCG